MEEGERSVPPQTETENHPDRWGYDTRFKYYLYRVGMLGNRGAESISAFPGIIELNRSWHETLDTMRGESRDGAERAIPFGYQERRREIHLPKDFIRGTRKEAIFATTKEVKERYGIFYQTGNIHTHPGGFWDRFAWKVFSSTKMLEGTGGMAPRDFYYMLDGYGLPIEVVVEKYHNYFAFRTEETKDIPNDSPLHSETAFERYWYRKHGAMPMLNNNILAIIKPTFSVNKMNIDIASSYNLALYKGKPGEDLVRMYP